MADCKEIDKALADLSRKIDGLNRRLDDTDRRVKNAEKCCNNKLEQGEKKEPDLADIMRRLSALENAVNKVLQYIESLENAIKASLNPLRILASLFNIF